MNLNNLKPAKGAVLSEKRIGRGQGSGHGGTSTVVTKERNHAQVIPRKLVSKVVRCHCSVVYRNSDSKILTA